MPPDDKKDPRPRRVSPLARGILWVVNIVVWLVISLVVSIIVEWVGIYTWWKDQGLDHSIQMFESEVQYANSTVSSSLLVADPQASVAGTLVKLDNAGLAVVNTIRDGLGLVVSYGAADITMFEELVISAVFITKTFILRLHLLVFALPLVALLFWHSVVDGLVERDLRKAGGARESNVIFDFSSTWTLWIVALGGFVYLASPISIHPLLILLPCGALFFFFSRTMFASYKKHI